MKGHLLPSETGQRKRRRWCSNRQSGGRLTLSDGLPAGRQRRDLLLERVESHQDTTMLGKQLVEEPRQDTDAGTRDDCEYRSAVSTPVKPVIHSSALPPGRFGPRQITGTVTSASTAFRTSVRQPTGVE